MTKMPGKCQGKRKKKTKNFFELFTPVLRILKRKRLNLQYAPLTPEGGGAYCRFNQT